MSGEQTIPRGRDQLKAGAEGATAPETLRQKDREGDELLEKRAALALTEGVIRAA
jgi:hypothetical protein